VHIETGPHKRAIQGTFFLYVWEPAGNRVELANSGARLILAPDWQPVCWTEADRRKGEAWGLAAVAGNTQASRSQRQWQDHKIRASERFTFARTTRPQP